VWGGVVALVVGVGVGVWVAATSTVDWKTMFAKETSSRSKHGNDIESARH
jgi:hypothetical protein